MIFSFGSALADTSSTRLPGCSWKTVDLRIVVHSGPSPKLAGFTALPLGHIDPRCGSERNRIVSAVGTVNSNGALFANDPAGSPRLYWTRNLQHVQQLGFVSLAPRHSRPCAFLCAAGFGRRQMAAPFPAQPIEIAF